MEYHYRNNHWFAQSSVPFWVLDCFGQKLGEQQNYSSPLHRPFQENQLKVIDVNPAVLSLFEADSVEMIRNHLDRIFPIQVLNELVTESAEKIGQEVREIETTGLTCRGKKVHLLLKLFTLEKTESNLFIGLSTIDITPYKSLAEEHALLAKLPEANPDIVLIMSGDGEIQYINPTGKKMIQSEGYTSKDSLSRILPESFLKEVYPTTSDTVRTPIRYTKEGKEYLMKVKPFPDEDRCMVIVSDITEITQLQKEKELYTQAMQAADQPIMITDDKGSIVHVNKAFSDFYGYSSQELIGQNPRILNPGRRTYYDLGYSPDDYERIFMSLWTAITDPFIGKWDQTIINRKKDGKLLWIRLMVSAVFSSIGKLMNCIAIPFDITSSVTESEMSKIELYKAIADLAELRDNETGNHMRRVGLFSRMIAKTIGSPERFCNDIEVFAPMHDIGKVGISDTILLAPRKLTEEEFNLMKTHTLIGYQIIKDKHDLEMAAEIVLNHHERYDGSGYPNHRSGTEIPLAARIASIADVYDALRSKRPYKEPWTHEQAIKEIQKHTGTQFDPDLIEVLLQIQDQFLSVSNRLRDG